MWFHELGNLHIKITGKFNAVNEIVLNLMEGLCYTKHGKFQKNQKIAKIGLFFEF